MPAIPVIMLAVTVASAAMAGYSQYRAGQVEKAGYDYNAKVAESEAEAARAGAAREEEVHREKLHRLLGTQRALFSAGGVDISSGSPLLTMMSTASEGEREAEYIKYGGEVEATRAMNEAKMGRFYGSQARKAGGLTAGSTFLSGLGQAGSSYAGMKGGTMTNLRGAQSASYGTSGR